MVRILQYIGSMEQGGSQAMIMNIYRNIDRQRVQFDFVIHAHGMTPLALEAQRMGAVIYTCPAFTAGTAGKYVAWWKKFLKDHPEYRVVHSHVRSTAAIVLKLAKDLGRHTVAHSHSTSSGSGLAAAVKNLLQYPIRFVAHDFMACSVDAGRWLFGGKVCASDRYRTVPNAIDARRYRYDREKARTLRQTLGYGDGDVVIGHVGRLTEPKNHLFILEVFRHLREKDGKYKLLLVGDGELREQLLEAVSKLGLEDSVTLLGLRQDVPELMMAMDLFLFPSKWEGLGIVAIEAQAAGTPCLASTGVPLAAKISDLMDFYPLDRGAQAWAEKIAALEPAPHPDLYRTVADSGYDIEASARWIQGFYLEKAGYMG